VTEYTFEQLFVGQTAQFSRTLSDEEILAFADVSGDHSPLHVDEAYARTQGFAGRVAHGLLSGGMYSALIGEHLPGLRALIRGVEMDFHLPVFAGVPLLIKGEITELHAEFRLVTVKAEIRDPGGKLLSRARIQVGLRAD
jgi:3-hydroxybutyryl-CoA dehydratase